MSFKTTTKSSMKNAYAFQQTASMLNKFFTENGIKGVNTSVRKYTAGDEVKTHNTGVEINAKESGVTHIFSFGEKYYEVGVNAHTGELFYDSYAQGKLNNLLNLKNVEESSVALLTQMYAAADIVQTSSENGQEVEVENMLLNDKGELVVDLMVA